MYNTDIKTIGYGNIGDKARQLVEKTPQLREIGFYTKPRVLLAEDFFDGFFQKNHFGLNLGNVEVTSGIEGRIRRGGLTMPEFSALCETCNSFGDIPLAVRSSAEGDSRGTGTYQTHFTLGYPNMVKSAMRKVLSSYFSKSAVEFRKDAKTGEGFGIMIEPLIGQQMDGDLFAPVLSGFGYTSTSRGEGYVTIVPGLGGGVQSKFGEKITLESIGEFGGRLYDYIGKNRMDILCDNVPFRESDLLKIPSSPSLEKREWRGDAISLRKVFRTRFQEYPHTRISFPEDIFNQFRSLDISSLFEMIGKMEKSFDKPQYFEWAMTLDGNPKYWINQIADVDKNQDIFDFSDLGQVLFSGKNVVGSGRMDLNKIVTCWNPHDVPSLHAFNQHNQDYVLIFSSRMTTSRNRESRLEYENYSRAKVLVEIEDSIHAERGSVVSHLGGQANVTGKIVATMDVNNNEFPYQVEAMRKREVEEHNITTYQGKVRVTASERQDKLIVGAID